MGLHGRAGAAPPCIAPWTFAPGGTGPGDRGNWLFDVDGAAAADVWAVGISDFRDNSFRGLAIYWDGAAWRTVPTPDLGADTIFFGVAAVAPNDAWIVGSVGSGIVPAQMLIEHWDGDAWTIAPSPLISGGGTLWDVAALASDDVWAVGVRPGRGLAVQWDGSAWVDRSPPSFGGLREELRAVDAVPGAVWAGGFRTVRNELGLTEYLTYVARWDGTRWRRVSVPTPGAYDFIEDVAVVAADDVWAVGSWYMPGEGSQPLILRYDGAAWSMIILPVFPEGSAELRGVAARSSDDVWAAGTHATDAGVPRPLLMHWDGISWSVVPAAPTGGSHEWFRGMQMLPGGDVWAVGQYFDGGATAPLVERLSPHDPRGDMNCDCVVNSLDVHGFSLALVDPAGYVAQYPACDIRNGDMNGDGAANGADIQMFAVEVLR